MIIKTLITALLTLVLVGSALAQDCGCLWNYQGRVTDGYGRSVGQARVTFDGCKDLRCTSWETKVTYTNTFGYFQFKDLEAAEYLIQIQSRRGFFRPRMVYSWSYPETFILTSQR